MQGYRFNLHIQLAAQLLRAGGVIAYPTEGVWGLGCDPLNKSAVEKILWLKDRPMHKGLILIASHIDQLYGAADNLTKAEKKQIQTHQNYPLTWLIPNNGAIPSWITGGGASLAVRVTQHPLVRQLCQKFGGAVVSTSANPGGRPAARDALAVRQYFRDEIDYLVPGKLSNAAGPSEIRDLKTNKIIRAR